MDDYNVNCFKAQKEILDALAESEEDIKNGRVGPALEMYNRLRKELLEIQTKTKKTIRKTDSVK